MTPNAPHTVTLPRGLVDGEGVQHRTVELRPITGHQEVAIASSADGVRARQVTALLTAAVQRIGAYTTVTADHVAALTRGDRHRLLLHLRRHLLGNRIPLTVRCPACGSLGDIDLAVDELAPEPVEAAPEVLHLDTPAGAAVVREPTGRDDEVLDEVDGDVPWRSAVLWSRLLLDLAGNGAIGPERWTALDPPVRFAVALGLADGSSAPDLHLGSVCPTCEAFVELALDPADLLARELSSGGDRLLAEVHCLAFHYHWPEDAILALPRTRRWRYIELLRRQLEGRDLVDDWRQR